MPHRYSVCGLTLACNVPLRAPGLRRGEGAVDVEVDWVGATIDGDAGAPPGSQVIVEPTGGWLAVGPADRFGEGWTRLRFGYGDHHVQFDVGPDASRVVATSTPGVPPVHTETLLFSTVMGYLLHRRGRLALHAGAVVWRGVAFAVAGVPGAGKSTTVAALLARGCTSVSDDVAALARQPQGWAVFPGLPGVRLTPGAQSALAVSAGAAVPLWPHSPQLPGVDYERLEDKAVVALGEPPHPRTAGVPIPLAGIFVLPPRTAAAGAPRITVLPAAAAVPRLAAQLLTPAWLAPGVDEGRFTALVDLAGAVPVATVERPDDLAALPALCDALLDQMARLRR